MSQKATYHCSSECTHSTVHATRYTFCVCFIFRLVCSWERRGGTANSVRLVASAERKISSKRRNLLETGRRSDTAAAPFPAFCNAAEHDHYTTLCYFLQQSLLLSAAVQHCRSEEEDYCRYSNRDRIIIMPSLSPSCCDNANHAACETRTTAEQTIRCGPGATCSCTRRTVPCG